MILAPGTGKTYLGVRITEMLLCNKHVWRRTLEQSTPILMICHTNHALDQFLELIVQHLNIKKGIIRVGSRCQNETIQQFSLSNARKNAREMRSTPKTLYEEKQDLMRDKMQTEAHLTEQENKLKYSQRNILFLSSLLEYQIVADGHYSSLKTPYSSLEARERALFDWLGVKTYDEEILDHLNEQNQNEYTLDGEENEEEQRRRNELDFGDDEDFHLSSSDRHRSTAKSKTNKRKRSADDQKLIEYILTWPTNLTDQIVQQIPDDIWQLSGIDRYSLYRYWLAKYQQYLRDSIQVATEEYQLVVSNLAKTRQDEDYHIIKNNQIVAMTTTCAAKYHRLLQKLR